MKRECIKTLFSQKMRVRHNAQIERFPPATVICSRGDFLKEGVLTPSSILDPV